MAICDEWGKFLFFLSPWRDWLSFTSALVLLSFHWLFFATYVTSSIIRCLCPFIIFHLLSCMPLPSRKPVSREDRKRIKYWLPWIQQFIRTEEKERQTDANIGILTIGKCTHTHNARECTHSQREREKEGTKRFEIIDSFFGLAAVSYPGQYYVCGVTSPG